MNNSKRGTHVTGHGGILQCKGSAPRGASSWETELDFRSASSSSTSVAMPGTAAVMPSVASAASGRGGVVATGGSCTAAAELAANGSSACQSHSSEDQSVNYERSACVLAV